MKHLILIGIIIFAASSTMAEDHFNCENDEEYQIFHNECTNHPKLKGEAGIGADVILWENENKEKIMRDFFAEYRYDANNDNHKIYGVMTFNLWYKIKKKGDK